MIAQELDIQVFKGQMDILVYLSTAELCTNHQLWSQQGSEIGAK